MTLTSMHYIQGKKTQNQRKFTILQCWAVERLLCDTLCHWQCDQAHEILHKVINFKCTLMHDKQYDDLFSDLLRRFLPFLSASRSQWTRVKTLTRTSRSTT